jgi:hypothetical protein
MENIRKQMWIKLVSSDEKAHKLMKKPFFKDIYMIYS